MGSEMCIRDRARAVESASLDEIKSVEGVEEKVAKKIYNFFHE